MADSSETRYKVGRVIDSYGLSGLGDELASRWAGDGTERASLRELADDVNRRLLRAAMVDAGMDPLDGEVANAYRLLTDETVGEGERTRTRRRLEREGVDVAALRDAFVTYQAVRTYLVESQGVTHDDGDDASATDAAESIARLQNRTLAVAEERFERLRRAGEISSGDLQLVFTLRVYCEDCGSQYDVEEFLRAGGCECG